MRLLWAAPPGRGQQEKGLKQQPAGEGREQRLPGHCVGQGSCRVNRRGGELKVGALLCGEARHGLSGDCSSSLISLMELQNWGTTI